jgi:hypothetical protein
MAGFAAILWFRGEASFSIVLVFLIGLVPSDSPPKRFPPEENRPWKRTRQTPFRKRKHDNFQRKTR